ncbi:uncharacterized protein METZ01_LOCUS279982, partial [marine metagenome]
MSASTIPLISRAEQHGDRVAIIASEGTFSYKQLMVDARAVACCLLD